MNKKFQVFVSSTYTDLIEERQAAVQAILDAGHIPAGMELFKAGNESQLKTIYKWIDQSDVYMLILGGRYGSIEPKSGKSYTQLEYEYALSKDIPVFAVVLSQTFLTEKINILGLNQTMDVSDQYNSFKSLVMTKIIREVDDCKDIKIAIHTTLNEFANEYNLVGWVRNTVETDNLQLIKENNSLTKENLTLNKEIQNLQKQLSAKSKEQFGNYSFDELVELFSAKKLVLPADKFHQDHDIDTNALTFFRVYFDNLVTGVSNEYGMSSEQVHIFYNIAPYFVSFGLLEKVKIAGKTAQRIQITKLGASFYAMLESKGMINH